MPPKYVLLVCNLHETHAWVEELILSDIEVEILLLKQLSQKSLHTSYRRDINWNRQKKCAFEIAFN